MLSLRSEVDANWLGTHLCKAIIQECFDDSISSGFSEWPKQLIDAVNEVRWLVKLSRLVAQIHITFLMRMEEFIRLIGFHCSLCALYLTG